MLINLPQNVFPRYNLKSDSTKIPIEIKNVIDLKAMDYYG
jgi:hypothetical protein